jgi:hypothetical protein
MMRIALRALVMVATPILAFSFSLMMKKRSSIDFSVDRHAKVTQFSDDIAKAVIQKGVKILADDDKPKGTDVPTDVPLVLKDKVGIFYDGDGIVKNQSDLDALFTKPRNVHVVREIHCCGGEKPGILGCSGAGKPIIVTEGIDLDSAAVLWMHELGHNKGLCHRARDDEFAIMSPTILVTNKTVNQYEHDVFEGATPTPCNQAERRKPEKIDVINFAHKVFIEGVPYEQGTQYTANDIRPLVELLDKSDEQRSWLNAIAVLGMIGDRRSWIPIKQAFERDSGELSRENYAAKLAVPLALGYLLSKGHDQRDQEIFDYLTTGLKHPGEWSKRVSWRESLDQSDQMRNAHLTMLTILGLGISGRTEALTALQTLYDELLGIQPANSHGASAANTGEAATSVRVAGLSEYEPEVLAVLRAAIHTNQRVQKDGLAKYYRDSELEQLGSTFNF